jgi:hypothetical protein
LALACPESVGGPLERPSVAPNERERRGYDAGGPVVPFARQCKEIVPVAIDALTFEQECDTALENASKLSE